MGIHEGGLQGIGRVIGSHLIDAADKVSYSLTERRLVPVTSEMRRAIGDLRDADGDVGGILPGPDHWSIPESKPRPLVAGEEPLTGTDVYTMKEVAFWPSDVSREVVHGGHGDFFGLAFPLEKDDIAHVRSLVDDGLSMNYEHTVFDMPTTGKGEYRVGNVKNPWGVRSPGILIHAEADEAKHLFNVRVDMQPFDYTNPHPGGRAVGLEPEVLAKLVATDPEMRSQLALRPKTDIVMLSGDVGRHEISARFARALHAQGDQFRRDVFFSNGSQVAWIDPPRDWRALSVHGEPAGPGHDIESAARTWTRYRPADS